MALWVIVTKVAAFSNLIRLISSLSRYLTVSRKAIIRATLMTVSTLMWTLSISSSSPKPVALAPKKQIARKISDSITLLISFIFYSSTLTYSVLFFLTMASKCPSP